MLINGSCPTCGGGIFKNEAGKMWCISSRPSHWWGNSFDSPPQPEREAKTPTGTQTLNQMDIATLMKTLNYKSKMQIYRLRRKLGDIEILGNTSDKVCIVLYPGGGKQHLPAPPKTRDFCFVSSPPRSPRMERMQLSSGLQHPYVVVNTPGNCSGQPLAIEYGLKS